MVGVVVVSRYSNRIQLQCNSVQCLVPSDGKQGLASPTPSGRMIDTTSKHQNMGVRLVVGDREYIEKMARTGHAKQKHNKLDAVHLPKNVPDSDEDGADDITSEDDNDQSGQDVFTEETGKYINIDEINDTFSDMHISCNSQLIAEGVRRFNKLVSLISPGKEDLIARSPFRNRNQSKHNQKPFDRNNPTANSRFGSGGQVYINSLQSNNQTLSTPIGSEGHVVSDFQKNNLTVSTPIGSGGQVYVNNVSHEQDSMNMMQDSEIQHVIQDFITFFNSLSFSQQEEFVQTLGPQNSTNQNIISKENNTMTDLQTQVHDPRLTNSPMSPNADLYDSSYETGSPGSSVTPSPSSPGYLSPPRNSVSSESDQELDPVLENNPIQKITKIIVIPAGQNLYQLNHSTPSIVKFEPEMKPLGEPIPCNRESATDRLCKLSSSTSYCKQHFSIQLVCVVMTTNAKESSERFKNFSKNLMTLMGQKVSLKQKEIDKWQLAIYAHIQFVVAAERMEEYSSALLGDGNGRSLLYMAAMTHHDKPLIARYIAESMRKVGIDHNEIVDEKQNTLLHALAKEGDSHCTLLGELVHATGPNGSPLFNLAAINKKGRTPLHVAVRSTKPHITTTVFLLQEGANPLQQDIMKKTPLHYHVKRVSEQWPRVSDDLALLKKMLNHTVPSSSEDTFILEMLSTDPKIPQDILSIIERELRLKKSEKH